MLALGRLKPSKFMKIQNLSNIFARRIVVKLFQLHRFTHAKVLLKRSQNLSCLLNDGTDSGGGNLWQVRLAALLNTIRNWGILLGKGYTLVS